jgi:uncharacterized membrane protein (DUF2068 family)
MSKRSNNAVGVRAIAIIEAIKGLLVLLVGFGLLSLVHHDVERFAAALVRHSHLNPASRYPHIFIETAAKATDARLWLLAIGAFLYAAVRLSEAYGLWYRRRWAEVFAVATGALYIPVEIYEVIERVTVVRFTVILVNCLVVAIVGHGWWHRKQRNF